MKQITVMKFTLRQIEVFLVTANCQNITQAAEQLSMSQSAASESLKALEGQFDVQLFDRIGKKLQLNELGKIVQRKAGSFMERAIVLEKTLSQHAEIGTIKVGATLSIGNYLAINIISDFRHRHPGANVTLDVANTTDIAHKVLNFEIDVGLIEGEITHSSLNTRCWREDELVVFCSPEHHYANRRNLSDQALKSSQWVLREPGSGTRQAFDHAMHGLLGELDVTLELQHTEAIKRAVEANMGLGCLSRITLTEAFNRGSLIPLAVPHRDFYRQFYFIVHKDKYLSAGIESWLACCEQYQR